MTHTTQAQHEVWADALDWAENHHTGKDKPLALRTLDHILAHDSSVAKAHYLKAEIIRDWGWRTQALKHYNAALQYQPAWAKDEQLMNHKFLVELYLKEYDAAHQTLDLLHTHSPNKVSYYQDKALLYINQSAYDKAIDSYEQAIALAPHQGKLYLKKGKAYQIKANSYPAKNLDAKAIAYQLAIKNYQTALTKGIESTGEASGKSDIAYCQHELNQITLQRQKQVSLAKQIAPWTAHINANPQHYKAYWERAHYYEQMGHYNEALQDFSKALENPEASTDTRIYLLEKKVSCQRYLQQYEQALATIHKVMQLVDNPESTLFSRHYIYFYQGDYRQALADINQLLAKHPQHGIYWGSKGEILFKLAKYATAWEAYQMAIKFDGAKAFDDKNVTACKLALGLIDNRDELMGQIKQYYWRSELDQGLDLIDTFLQKYPKDAEAYFYKGQICKQYARYASAIDAYEQALRLRPAYARDEEFVNNKATMHAYAGQPTQAIADYEAATKLDFKQAGKYHGKIAQLYVSSQDFSQAELHFGLAINFSRQDNDRALAYWNRGLYHLNEQKFYIQAQIDLTNSVKLKSNWADEDLAEVNQILAHLDTAKTVTQELEKDPNNAKRIDLLLKRAMAYYHSEQNKQAWQDLEEAGKLKPAIAEDLEAGFYWGELAYLLQEYERAIEIFEKTRQKHPTDKDVLSYLGQVYLDHGDYKKAIEVFDFLEKNCVQVQEYVEIYAYRGKAKFALKAYSEALKDFERYLLYTPYLESYIAKEMKICKEMVSR